MLKTGRLDAAIAEYQRALKINPNFAQAHYNLGVALAQKGLIDEAITQFEEAVRLNPNLSAWQASLAQARALLHFHAVSK